MSTKLMNLLLALLLLVTVRGAFSSQLDRNVAWARKELVDRSLRGYWKLADDSNFRINSKITMINEQTDRKRRVTSMLNFISATNTLRQAEAFFQTSQPGEQATGLYLKLYDGKYHQNATVIIQIDLQSSMERGVQNDGKYIAWSNSKPKFVTCLLLRDGQIIGRFSVGVAVQIVTNMRQNRPMDSSTKIDIKFESSTFSFRAFLAPIANEYNSFIYAVSGFTIAFALAVGCFRANKAVYNLSEWMIVQVAAFVLSTSLILIGEVMKKLDTDLKYVGLCAVANIALSLFFLRKYENVTLNEFNNRSKIVKLLVFLAIYFGLVFFLHKNLVLWIYQGFMLLAMQINYSYSVGGKGGMEITLVLTIIFTRVPFIYYRYYLQSLSRQPNNPKLLILFIGVHTVLLSFITMQRYLGSRFIIPNELIPDYFNYYKKIARGNQKLEQVCPICTQPFKDNPQQKTATEVNQEIEDEQQQDKEEQDQERERQRGEQERQRGEQERQRQANNQEANFAVLMITPCGHEFHPSCLQDWMDKRLNCPICRAVLPPSQQQRDDSYCC